MSETPYLTAAASIGMTHKDIALFIKRLDKVFAQKSKRIAKAEHASHVENNHVRRPHSQDSVGQRTPTHDPMGRKTPTQDVVGRKTPTHDPIGRKTPTHDPIGRKTPIQIVDSPGRKTPVSVVDGQGRKTPTQIPDGRKTPTIPAALNNNHSPKNQSKLLAANASLQSTDV